MKNCLFVILFTFILAVCFSSLAFADGKNKSKSIKKTKQTIEDPFDASLEKLPPNFWGNNLLSIYGVLSKNASKYDKNEFETNEAFQARMIKLEEQLLVDNLKYNSTIAVPLLANVKNEYNADKGVTSVTIPLGHILDEDISNGIEYELPPGQGAYSYSPETVEGHAIEVFTSQTKSKKYTGSNAFGVKVKITAKLYQTVSLAVKNDYRLMRYGESITLEIPMSPEKAREAKTAGNVLLVGEILHPYVGEGRSHSNATINDPVEFYDMIGYVGMKLSSIWFYNIKSGEVYHKEPISYPVVVEPSEAKNVPTVKTKLEGSDYAGYIQSRLTDAIHTTSSYTSASPEVAVRLTIAADGRLSRMKIERSSGDATFELAVRRAIDLASEKFTSTPDKNIFEGVFLFTPKGITFERGTIRSTDKMVTLKEKYQVKFASDIGEGNTSFLNYDDIVFGSFFRRFEGAVYGVWRYPQEAALRGIEGITPVRITFNRRGEITNIKQLESSGARTLDEEVLRTLRAIGPVGGFPKGYDKEEFHLIVFFQYGGARRSLR